MTDITFPTFESEALSRGFDEVLPREWSSGQVVGEHKHPFGVRARVVQGEMWYGPEGATYWAARRSAAAPA